MALLNQADKQRIEARVAAAEQGTAAEIVVATVARSDSYQDVRLFAALLSGVVVASALHLLWPAMPVGELLAIQVAAGLLTYALSALPAVLRLLVPRARTHAAVKREAELSFLEHALFNTRDRNGVLILLSELEHNVTILGDQGIHARVQNAGWEQHVTTIVAAIRRGQAVEGVCQVIDALAALLAEREPVKHDDTNELDNRVRERTRDR